MERSRKTRSIGDILSALTIAVLFIVILLLACFAAKSYEHSSALQYENDSHRVICAYVATAIKDHTEGEVTPMDMNGNPGVSIEDGDTGYAHKIYLNNGLLLEEYTKADAPVNPEAATKIGETSQFDIRYISEDLLEIKTDKGASYVHVQR